MDTLSAFAMGRANQGRPLMVRAREMLVHEGDDFWFANTLRALAARLEGS